MCLSGIWVAVVYFRFGLAVLGYIWVYLVVGFECLVIVGDCASCLVSICWYLSWCVSMCLLSYWFCCIFNCCCSSVGFLVGWLCMFWWFLLMSRCWCIIAGVLFCLNLNWLVLRVWCVWYYVCCFCDLAFGLVIVSLSLLLGVVWLVYYCFCGCCGWW